MVDITDMSLSYLQIFLIISVIGEDKDIVT